MGMLQVVFNIEVGNYYSKSTFIMTLIKQDKLVFGHFIHSGLSCVPGYPKIPNFGYPVP